MPEKPTAQVKVGNVSVPVFRWADGRWWVRWREDGRIRKLAYKSADKARAKARVIATRLNNGLPTLADMTASDRQIYHHACDVAKREGFSVSAMLDDWQRLRANAPERKPRITVAEYLPRFLADKREHRLSPRYMSGLIFDLGKFAQAFEATAFQEIKAAQLTDWLRTWNVGLRRRNNIRDELVTFFVAAKKAGHLPEDRKTEAEKVDRVELEDWTPSTFTPAELQTLLDHVSSEWLPWLCLTAFAGMRSEEVACVKESKRGEKRQLVWGDFKWEHRKIDVPAMLAKDRRRRLIPISDQLLAWLEPWKDKRGPVCPEKRLNAKTGRVVKDRYDREVDRLKEATGIAWKPDTLRHSFCSYWLAKNHDIHELARAVGNSPAMIKKHYESAKYPHEAEAWFGILPDRPGNIIQSPLGLSYAT